MLQKSLPPLIHELNDVLHVLEVGYVPPVDSHFVNPIFQQDSDKFSLVVLDRVVKYREVLLILGVDVGSKVKQNARYLTEA